MTLRNLDLIAPLLGAPLTHILPLNDVLPRAFLPGVLCEPSSSSLANSCFEMLSPLQFLHFLD